MIYHVGQRVRIEWPDGATAEGTLRADPFYGDPVLFVPGCEGYIDPSMHHDYRTVTVLREPIPDEPTGRLALFEGTNGRIYIRLNGAWFRVLNPPAAGDWSEFADGGRVVWAGEQP